MKPPRIMANLGWLNTLQALILPGAFPLLKAGSLMATAPIIVLFLLLQRHFIEGIALSGSKA